MTLSASTAVDRYAAAELQTVFPYSFKILDTSHMTVYEGDAAITTGFTVSGVGSDTGGNVTYATAPRGTGDAALTVTLKRAVPLSQPDDLPAAGALNTDTLESMIDKSRMIDQQLDEVDQRSIRVPVSSSLTDLEVTPAASALIGFDVAGTALATYAAAAIAAGIIPTTFMQALLADATAAAAAATLEVLPLAGGAMTGPINYASATGITAGTPQTQVGATALTEEINTVTVVGTDGDGVALPSAVAGGRVTVRNDDASEYLQVWPASGDAIDAGAVDAVDADPIGPGAWRTYVAADGTTWKREAQKAEFYVGSFTRDLTTAAGAQTVTGPTFKPTAIFMLAATGAAGEGSIGFSNGVLDAFLRDNYGITANTWNSSTSRSVSIITSGSIYSQGYVTALLPRGWTFTWEKAGAPTGTATIAYLAIRS